MRTKTLTLIAVLVAVVAAGISAAVVSANRASEARARAELAAAKADQAEAKKREADKLADAERMKKNTAEENRKAKMAEAEAKKAEEETAKIEERTAIENRKAKEAEAKTRAAEAEIARATKDAEKAKAQAAREEKEKAAKLAEAEALKLQKEETRLATEKLKGEKILAEAKLLELRQIDFQTMERDLVEWQRDLNEREAALRPDKTVADLAWVGGDDDMVVDSNGTVRVKAKVPYLAEKDRTLPRQTRHLAKVERLAAELAATNAALVKATVVASVEKLYVQALKNDDVVNAAYYRKSLKSLYPDWEFKGAADGTEAVPPGKAVPPEKEEKSK